MVTFGDVCHPPAVEQSAGQDRQGAQLLWLLMNFRNNHSPLPLSKQKQSEVRSCKYNMDIPPGSGKHLAGISEQVPQPHCAWLWAGIWLKSCRDSLCTRVLAGRFYLQIRESF